MEESQCRASWHTAQMWALCLLGFYLKVAFHSCLFKKASSLHLVFSFPIFPLILFKHNLEDVGSALETSSSL